MTKRLYIIFSILIVLGFPSVYFGWRYLKNRDNTTKYSLALVKKGNLSASVSATGELVIKESALVDPQVSGVVKKIYVNKNDYVEAGAKLFEIENDALDVQKAKAWADYLKAKETEENVKAKPSPTESELASASANAASAWQSYQEAKKNAEERLVKAPITGTITELNIKVGDTLPRQKSASSTSSSENPSGSAITIANLKSLVAKVNVPEADIAKVKNDNKVTLTLDALPDLTLTGEVYDVENVGISSQGVVNYTVYISLDTLPEQLRAGMTVSANIITETKTAALMVPVSAVKTAGEESYVEVISDENLQKRLLAGETLNNLSLPLEPKRVTVKTGISNDEYIEILSGLSENEVVVVSKQTNKSTSTSGNTGRFGGQLFNFPRAGGGGGGVEMRMLR